MTQYFSRDSDWNGKFEMDLSDCATKADLKVITVKTKVDTLDVNKVKTIMLKCRSVVVKLVVKFNSIDSKIPITSVLVTKSQHKL